MDYDFSGWATRANLKCSDGRTIMPNAFKHMDGMTRPLVWMHQHNDSNNVLGHALLESRPEGVYAYCTFNNTDSGQNAKLLVQHGDVNSLSIYANRLQESGGNVMHGEICEVSLVLAGANPGAYIDSVIKHGEEMEDEAIIFTGEELTLSHADDEEKKDTKNEDKNQNQQKSDDEETVADVLETLTDKQKLAVYAIVGQIVEDSDGTSDDEEDEDDKGGNTSMKHNVFDKETEKTSGVLTHAAQGEILDMAKTPTIGTFQTALKMYAEEHDLAHAAAPVSGFDQTVNTSEPQGNVGLLFPEYRDVRPGAPELITNDQGWISTVMAKVHKSPISRIRTGQVDIRNIDSLRARGYQKGKEKKYVGNIKLVRRTTDPQTVYVKSALHRDDIVDITDFDYVQYMYNIDRMMLNEELATAIMLGDNREDADEGKIMPEHIRPIWTDDDLYTMHYDLDLAAAKKELQGTNTDGYFGENYILAEAMVNACLYSREKFKGSGTPDMFITPHNLNVMLLARDMNGRRIYSSKAELASALNVGAIYTVEQFEGKKRKDSNNKEKELVCMIVNLNDYALGATKGGEITHFTQFDIDFNQQKSLLETRCSGALTKVYSAIVIEQPVTASSTEDPSESQGD